MVIQMLFLSTKRHGKDLPALAFSSSCSAYPMHVVLYTALTRRKVVVDHHLHKQVITQLLEDLHIYTHQSHDTHLNILHIKASGGDIRGNQHLHVAVLEGMHHLQRRIVES